MQTNFRELRRSYFKSRYSLSNSPCLFQFQNAKNFLEFQKYVSFTMLRCFPRHALSLCRAISAINALSATGFWCVPEVVNFTEWIKSRVNFKARRLHCKNVPNTFQRSNNATDKITRNDTPVDLRTAKSHWRFQIFQVLTSFGSVFDSPWELCS